MWFDNAVIYQIYPLGLCGAPRENDGAPSHRILRVLDWVEHIRDLGADTVLFNPLFDSDRHGYDTRDYRQVDCRLGTNEDFKEVCDALHAAGLRVMLDGVFNHVGRGFWAFRSSTSSTPSATGWTSSILTDCAWMWPTASAPTTCASSGTLWAA